MPAKKSTATAHEPTPLDTAMQNLAASLKDAISATDSAYLAKDPEEAFTDLACRFILGIQRRGLTVISIPTIEDELRVAQIEAAGRILEILTTWMLTNPGCSYDTRRSPSGKFQIVVKTPTTTELFFGESLQDAYAQAASTINFNDGTL